MTDGPARTQATEAAAALQAYRWEPQPRAATFVRATVHRFLAACPPALHLSDRMREEAGTRFVDWIDSIALPRSDALHARIVDLGFEPERIAGAYSHGGGLFPRIVLADAEGMAIGLRVESVADFLAAQPIPGAMPPPGAGIIEGPPLAALRRACVARAPEAELWVVERQGPAEDRPIDVPAVLRHTEALRLRARDFDRDEEGFDHAHTLLDAAIADLGPNRTCDLFFAGEREYWQRRNRAAQVQKARQDRLGLGWANHDHHTYRSSRRCFRRLIAVFEKLGLVCRERFYAGREAGWGAQVLEQPEAGIVVFADVDLFPEELPTDFAHQALPERQGLGTVGLWCALHGEAFLQAGMHHLECRFDFEALQRQLETRGGVHMMKPFTDLPYLRQAFTEGERWPVQPRRIDALLKAGLITTEQARQFQEQGAIGSHLENLERHGGFKGFNQAGVNQIIAETDPRKEMRPAPISGA